MAQDEQDDVPGGSGDAMGWLQLLIEANKTLHASLGGALPAEFRRHARASRREGLLALRCLIDAQIERLEHDDEPNGARQATKINVQ